jgi:hypothetical protein
MPESPTFHWGMVEPIDPPHQSDDTLSLQAAINAATVGGTTLYLQPGIYAVSGTLYVTCTVQGSTEGVERSQINFSGVSGDCFQFPVGSYGGLSDVDILQPASAESCIRVLSNGYDWENYAGRSVNLSRINITGADSSKIGIKVDGSRVAIKDCSVTGSYLIALVRGKGISVTRGVYTNTYSGSSPGVGIEVPSAIGLNPFFRGTIREASITTGTGVGVWLGAEGSSVWRCSVTVGEIHAVAIRADGCSVIGGSLMNTNPTANSVLDIGIAPCISSVSVVEPVLPTAGVDISARRIHFGSYATSVDLRVWSDFVVTSQNGLVDHGPSVTEPLIGLSARLACSTVGDSWVDTPTLGVLPHYGIGSAKYRSTGTYGLELPIYSNAWDQPPLENRYAYVDFDRGDDVFDALDGYVAEVSSVLTAPQWKSDYYPLRSDVYGMRIRTMDASGNTLALVDGAGDRSGLGSHSPYPEPPIYFISPVATTRRFCVLRTPITDPSIDKIRVEFWITGETFYPDPAGGSVDLTCGVSSLRVARGPLLPVLNAASPATALGVLGIAGAWHPIGSSASYSTPPSGALGGFNFSHPGTMFMLALNAEPSVGEPWGWIATSGDSAWSSLDVIA